MTVFFVVPRLLTYFEMGHRLKKIIYTNLVLTSQETHYVSATKIDRLMHFGETIIVYFENHKKYIIAWVESLLQKLIVAR
jgi:hypothetical protein